MIDPIITIDEDGTTWLNISIKSREFRLDEANYKKITSLIDESFLQQRIRAAALEGVSLSSINDEQGEMIFFVKSSLYRKNSQIYANTVKFKEWNDVVNETDLNPIGRARLLMFDGNISLNCTCPSFLYWGYRYILTRYDASLFPEKRPPVKRNPSQRGIVCKHMNRVIKAFPFYSGDLANHIKKYHDTEAGKESTEDLKTKIADHLRDTDSINVDYEDVT